MLLNEKQNTNKLHRNPVLQTSHAFTNRFQTSLGFGWMAEKSNLIELLLSMASRFGSRCLERR